MRQVRHTAAAIQDLKDIYSYIAEDNHAAAARVLARLEKRWHILVDNPRIGHKRDDLQVSLRTVAEGNYVIFYRPIANGIELVRFLHSSRNINKIFGKHQD